MLPRKTLDIAAIVVGIDKDEQRDSAEHDQGKDAAGNQPEQLERTHRNARLHAPPSIRKRICDLCLNAAAAPRVYLSSMNVLPLLVALPHALAAARPDDSHMAVLAVLVGMGFSIKLSMARQRAKVRREKFIRERQSLKDARLRRDNESR